VGVKDMLTKENLDIIEEMILSNNVDTTKIAITMLRNSKTESKELNKHKRVLQFAAEFLAKNTEYLPNNYPTKDVKTWFVKNFEFGFYQSLWRSKKHSGVIWASKKSLIK
jgi:hypothetical protein